MSAKTKRELLLKIRDEYLSAGRQRKQELLNTLVNATGYNRKYAIALLSNPPEEAIHKRKRKKIYDERVASALKQVWIAANGICPKRFIPFLRTLVESLERHGHLQLEADVREKLLAISASTADRMLELERKKGFGKSLTRPGSLLRKQIAVKTFSDWNDMELGFFEIDCVAHCGDNVAGKYLHTLTMTDVATGWTELSCLLTRSEQEVRDALDEVRKVLPFALKGIDTDNGGEFLNYEMVKWCHVNEITFTRSRAYRKNDQAHVEEKNGSVVRRIVGYERYEGGRARQCMLQLYSVARIYINFFQPSMKLISKTREGAKVTKRYDTARTPLERLLELDSVPRKLKNKLRREFDSLDPLALLTQMAKLQSRLWRYAVNVTEATVIENTQAQRILKRARRKKRYYPLSLDTPTAKMREKILALPYGAEIQASDFLDDVARRKSIIATLWKFCKEGFLVRHKWGKYTRINPREYSPIVHVTKKIRKKET